LRAVGGPAADTRQFVSREELKALLALEPGEASVSTQEAEMIDKIFDLGDTTVREVMVPLVDVVMLPADASSRDAIALIQQRGFSRIPIYGARETDVVGVVTAMDLLNRGAQVRTVTELMRQPNFVPETKRIDDLLREMQKGRNPLAIVVDEYGSATGIVTLEDIVEQIVGEIQDEHDRTPATVEPLPDGSYWVAARTHIDELNEALDWSCPSTTTRRWPAWSWPRSTASPGWARFCKSRVYHHGARGRCPPGRGGEDRAHGRAAGGAA
jgi:CBS domain containing-hemolysin-like protein